jgi:hypothetical protein
MGQEPPKISYQIYAREIANPVPSHVALQAK